LARTKNRQLVFEVADQRSSPRRGSDFLSAAALFEALDVVEERLSRQRYLVGARATEADWRLFTTLVRFDSVYYSNFKCNLPRIVDYPNLANYLRDLYQQPGVAETVNMIGSDMGDVPPPLNGRKSRPNS
jgi:glutathione S-transferase